MARHIKHMVVSIRLENEDAVAAFREAMEILREELSINPWNAEVAEAIEKLEEAEEGLGAFEQ